MRQTSKILALAAAAALACGGGVALAQSGTRWRRLVGNGGRFG